MPIVKRMKCIFGGQEYTLKVHLAKDGTFTAPFPEYARKALGQDRAVATTLKKVLSEFEAFRQQYAEMLTARRKVICYNFQINAPRRFDDGLEARRDISFGCGNGLTLAVMNAIAIEHKSADGEVKRTEIVSYDADNDNCQIPQPYPEGFNRGNFVVSCDRWQRLDWTQQREDWFIEFCNAMNRLINRIQKLDEDQKVLQSYIEQLVPLTPITHEGMPKNEPGRKKRKGGRA